MSTGLTEEQRSRILLRSQQAQNFLGSELFKELMEWINQEKQAVTTDLVYDRRGQTEKVETRTEFIERRSAYWIALDTLPAIFRTWAAAEVQLKKIEAEQANEQPD